QALVARSQCLLATGRFALCSHSTQSPFGGRPGSLIVFTVACSPRRMVLTFSAYSIPSESLSGRITTLRPASGVQSVLSAHFAPCELVVTSNPVRSRNSHAHFSPSTSTTSSCGRSRNCVRLNKGNLPGGSFIAQPPALKK